MNYRQFYEEQTGLYLPDDFDIHHIDLNRENNEITNLVSIPKSLHQEYHKLASYRTVHVEEMITTESIDQTPFLEEHFLKDALDFVKVKKKFYMYVVFRNKLLGDHLSMQICKSDNYEQVKIYNINNE